MWDSRITSSDSLADAHKNLIPLHFPYWRFPIEFILFLKPFLVFTIYVRFYHPTENNGDGWGGNCYSWTYVTVQIVLLLYYNAIMLKMQNHINSPYLKCGLINVTDRPLQRIFPTRHWVFGCWRCLEKILGGSILPNNYTKIKGRFALRPAAHKEISVPLVL